MNWEISILDFHFIFKSRDTFRIYYHTRLPCIHILINLIKYSTLLQNLSNFIFARFWTHAFLYTNLVFTSILSIVECRGSSNVLPIIIFDEAKEGRCHQVAKFRAFLEPWRNSSLFRGRCVFRKRWYSFSRPLILDGLGGSLARANRQTSSQDHHPLDQPKLPRRSREILVSRIFELFYAAASTSSTPPSPWHLFLFPPSPKWFVRRCERELARNLERRIVRLKLFYFGTCSLSSKYFF